jgi:hypothetical protein
VRDGGDCPESWQEAKTRQAVPTGRIERTAAADVRIKVSNQRKDVTRVSYP